MAKITFLGLGAMGIRMVKHLLDSNHKVTVWNRTLDKANELIECGATLAKTPAEAALDADFVIAMVRDDAASQFIWLDSENGALTTMRAGAIAIESSTLTPSWVTQLAEKMAEKGVGFVDAPVAGSRPQAEAKKLIFLVGAENDNFAKVEPVLKEMGGPIQHCGPVSAGAKVKLVINALLGVQVAAVAELIGLLKKSEVNTETAVEIIAGSSVASPALAMSSKAMLAETFAPMFPVELIEKDFTYLQEFAETFAVKTPVADTVQRVFNNALNTGFADENMTAVAKLY